jgi:uncharacterized membrane protein YdbT with pleckstrin-like domain
MANSIINSESTASDEDAQSRKVIRKVTPTLRPTVISFTMVFVVGGFIIGFLMLNPNTIANEPELTRLAWNAIGVIVVLILIRLALRMAMLRRTHYTIRTDKLIRETDLIIQYRAREVPVRQLRGYEYSQNAIQRLLGYGDIQILTAGTNRSLGFLEFENIQNPRSVRRDVESIRDNVDA